MASLCASSINCQACPSWQHSAFKYCQLDELERLALSKTSCTYQKGQVIFREGSRPAGVYCMHSGMVKLTKRSGDKEQIMRLAHNGDVMGYRALLSNGTYSVSAVAMSDCVVCQISRTDFLSVVGQNAQFTQSLIELLSAALEETEERMLHMAYKPVRERLAEALLLLYRKFNKETEELFSLPISREDLASLVGTAKETVSRLISEFKEEGFITTKGSRITILTPKKLEKIACFYD